MGLYGFNDPVTSRFGPLGLVPSVWSLIQKGELLPKGLRNLGTNEKSEEERGKACRQSHYVVLYSII